MERGELTATFRITCNLQPDRRCGLRVNSRLDSYSEGMKNRLSMLGGHAEDSEQAAHASAKRFVVVVDR
jgi:hypothetical protein